MFLRFGRIVALESYLAEKSMEACSVIGTPKPFVKRDCLGQQITRRFELTFQFRSTPRLS